MSSFFSLIIGTIVGLTQFRIKRLLAYSTISHVGFILLALSISSIESTQAFLFYLIQYSISNLNIFFILILIGYTLYHYVSTNKEYNELLEKNYSPIQLISQLKGYYYINPILSLSLIITIFSFIGIPPLIGFFAKQMVLSAALDKGFIFLTLIAIITSVIGAVYYLNIVKEIFFSLPLYKSKSFKILLNNHEKRNILNKYIPNKKLIEQKTQSIIYLINIKTTYKLIISNVITIVISIITLLILLFIFINKE
jgi:NADH-ubiquinone oxidoreductase chain 2